MLRFARKERATNNNNVFINGTKASVCCVYNVSICSASASAPIGSVLNHLVGNVLAINAIYHGCQLLRLTRKSPRNSEN